MKKQNNRLKWIGFGIISLPLFILVISLMTNLCCKVFESPYSWWRIAYLVLTTLLVLLAVWIIHHYYLNMVNSLFKQQMEIEKLEKKEEIEKHLEERHHEYKLEAMKYDIQKQKLDLKMKKLETKKK